MTNPNSNILNDRKDILLTVISSKKKMGGADIAQKLGIASGSFRKAYLIDKDGNIKKHSWFFALKELIREGKVKHIKRTDNGQSRYIKAYRMTSPEEEVAKKTEEEMETYNKLTENIERMGEKQDADDREADIQEALDLFLSVVKISLVAQIRGEYTEKINKLEQCIREKDVEIERLENQGVKKFII